ncbi:MAG: helix-turn-helix transcriptional regulator [Pseudonocardiales bacterium]|nr:helix-turn-helix transcriptional regulator [Pseudonocardiales bacterium]
MERRLCRVCRGPRSRYNPDSVCAGCARQIATTPRFPLWLWDSLPLRRAFAELDLGAALTIIRTAPGLSQLEFGTLVGWSQSAVGRVEAGQRDSLYDIRRLFQVVDAVGMPREALIPLLLGTPGPEQSEREETDDMDVNRRQFSGGLIGFTAATGLSRIPVPAKVDPVHVRYLRSSVEKLWAKDGIVGGGTLVRDGLYLYHRARRMLDEADYSEATGQQLMSVVGELAVCVGWLAYDADQQNVARELYSEARLLADQSGDHGLAIHALEKMSLQSTYLAHKKGLPGRAREAARLSARATELARHDPSPQLHALLASREALAHAAAGDSQGFMVAITRAWREVDREFTDDAPVWVRFMDSWEITALEGRGRSYLGDHSAAATLYRKSLKATLRPRSSAIYRAGLAAALAGSGDVNGAVAEATVVLTALDTGGVMSPRALARLHPVRQAAARDRQGEQFCAHYDQLGTLSVGDSEAHPRSARWRP